MADQEERKLTPRTPREILERFLSLDGKNDLYSVERSQLLERLPFNMAKPYLEKDSIWFQPGGEEKWQRNREELLDLAVIREGITGFLGYAWMRANRWHHMSAQRLVALFRVLIWFMGPKQDKLVAQLEGEDDGFHVSYAYYGKPALVLVSELVGFNWSEADDDKWYRDRYQREDPVTAHEALEELDL